MTAHAMLFTEELPFRDTNIGWGLFIVEQSSAAKVEENDTLVFKNVASADIRILSMRSATGQVVNCDTKSTSSGDTTFTVDHQEVNTNKRAFGTLIDGDAETSITGLVLARHVGG